MDLFQPITLPLWLLLIVLLAAAWALLERLFIPSVRWMLRRRVNRVLDEISTRLEIEIRPFQLTKRQVLIDRLVYDPKVIDAINAHAQQQNMPREVAQAKVVEYAREIVPAFNAYIYFRVGYWLAKRLAKMLYRVRAGFKSEQRLQGIDPQATVVFVMNHRSNMDYVLAAFLVAESTTLSYAVGEWARVWPLQTLIRSMGAFFVRRSSGDPLYRKVLERYISMATREGVCQAVFLEGGLSKDGKLRSPKLGILDYMLRGYDPEKDRDIVFVPVGINYDRVLEDRTLLRGLDPNAERRSKSFVLKTTLMFVLRNIKLAMLSRWRRLGYAQVNFGEPFSARNYCESKSMVFSDLDTETRFAEVENIALNLMQQIKQVIPVLPVALVSKVFVDMPDSQFTAADVVTNASKEIADLESKGYLVNLPKHAREFSIKTALDMLVLRNIVSIKDEQYFCESQSQPILKYYANSLVDVNTNS